jgi:hypothetical protein
MFTVPVDWSVAIAGKKWWPLAASMEAGVDQVLPLSVEKVMFTSALGHTVG